MGAAVGQARDGARVDQHLVGCPQIAVDVVRNGDVDDPAGRHDVVGQLVRRHPGRCGALGQCLRRPLVVAGGIGELEGPGEAGHEICLAPQLGQDLLLELGSRQFGQEIRPVAADHGLEGRRAGEGIDPAVGRHQEASGPGRDLTPQRQAVARRAREPVEYVAVVVARLAAPLQ